MNLKELKIKLKKMIAEEGIAATIKALKEALPEPSERYEDVLLIESRQNEANRQRLRNLLSNEDLQITYARIREDLMDLIDAIEEDDFDEARADAGLAAGQKIKKGSILHRIPDQMALNEETKCIVRIAFDEEVIIRNIDLDEEVVLKPIRVSDIMQVELIDPSDEHPFQVNAISSAEQFIDEDDYTEWIFYVTPLMEGTYPLILKVAVIELIHGKERKREMVLEETIQIVTKAENKEEQGFRSADLKLEFGAAAPLPGGKRAEQPDPGPEEKAGKTRSADISMEDLSKYADKKKVGPNYDGQSDTSGRGRESGRSFTVLRRMTMAILAIVVVTGTSYAIVPSEVDWLRVKYLADNKKAYANYIQKYDDSRHLEEAYFRKAVKEPQLKDLREYTQKFPSGKYLPTIKTEIREIEKDRFDALQLNPSRERLENYLETFPQGAYTDEVRKKVESIDRDLKIREDASLLDRETQLWRKILQENNEEDLNTYIKRFPDGKHQQEARKRLNNLRAEKEINNLKNARPEELEKLLKRFEEKEAQELIKNRLQKIKEKN